MYIRVHVLPGAKKEVVKKDAEGVYTISVKEPAQQNFANKRIREILADECGVPFAQITLLTGHRSSSKMYSVDTSRY